VPLNADLSLITDGLPPAETQLTLDGQVLAAVGELPCVWAALV
jgi:hypothetical protein